MKSNGDKTFTGKFREPRGYEFTWTRIISLYQENPSLHELWLNLLFIGHVNKGIFQYSLLDI